jgi:hypothetical protein
MNKHIGLIVLFVAAGLGSQIMPQADGSWFFAAQSFWSILLIFGFTAIGRSRVIDWLCILEYAHIINHFIACFAYLTGLLDILAIYPIILVAINVIELMLLDLGAPWNGILKRLQSLWRVRGSWRSLDYRSVQNHFRIGAKNP